VRGSLELSLSLSRQRPKAQADDSYIMVLIRRDTRAGTRIIRHRVFGLGAARRST